ncbi:D-xylose-proton symporter-like 3 [Hibiscus syriacus]|uniref:D-xylose-proton symporter-like 3 n=1 Tax=Hibiscus syriacus TaxID=106335 RepID=A0A6A3ANB7_HIBSY|nr:D-xylose-proton symporter-like 3 [Hibiscus syriacus]
MACGATAQPLLNLELSHSQQPKRPYTFSLCSFTKSRLSPKPFSFQSKDHTKLNIFATPSLFSRKKPGSHVAAQSDYSSGEEASSLLPESAYQEPFSWSSVILPFLFPALGGLLFGYDIGATSGATISLQSPELSGTTWFNLSAVQLGLVVSGSLYGALLGSLLVYPIADFLGRRRELIIASLLYLLGGVLTAYAPDLSVLLVGRLLYGLGIGSAMHGAPLYIAETCPSQIRGTLISLKELFIVLGILLGYFVGNFQIDAVGGWRYMYGCSAPIALLMGLGMWSLPPSPRWLILRAVQGKASLQEYKEKAILALSKLRGRAPGDEASEKQIEDTLNSVKFAYAEQESEGNILEVLQGPSLKAFIIGGGLVLFQQITGQPSVLYYAGPILQSAGFSAAADATRLSVVVGLFKLLMTWIAVAKVDDLGRRPLLIGGVGGIVCNLFLSFLFLSVLAFWDLDMFVSMEVLICLYELVALQALSLFLLCAYYKFLGEFPYLVQHSTVNFESSSLLISHGAYDLQELLGAENLFLLFGAIALLSLLFVVFYVPETKGLSLEEIESKILK